MRKRGRRGLWASVVVGVVAASVAAGCSSGVDGSAATPTTTPPAGAPEELVTHPGDWVLPGRDYDNSRATTDSQIDATTIRRLEVAWRHDVEGSLSTVPLVVGDTVYLQDGTGTVAALDRDSGAVRWQSESHGLNIGPFGVAVADGRVFALHGSTGVVALDAATGAELWVRDITATPSTGIDIQPTVYDGLVLVSTVPVSIGGIYRGGDHGVVNALDAETGEVRWTFDTVVDDLWGNPAVNSGGGAWYPPAVDTEQGLVVWGVANPAPFPGTPEFPNGSSRPGPDLYTDSAVALDVHTGALRWFHQVHAHDLFDRDLVHTMVARTADGPVVVATGKGGVVVGLDPSDGAPRWTTPVGHHENDELTALEGPTTVAPGTFGGVLTPPATAAGVVFVAVVDAPVTLVPDQTSYFGAQMGQFDGSVVAIDAATGEQLWEARVPGDPLGGTLVVNDLVLTATLQGTIVALDRQTGDVVWQEQAPGGINGWMVAAGDLLVVPVGNADPGQVVAYRLG
jgi:outer membrane protein assembly factor BamB